MWWHGHLEDETSAGVWGYSRGFDDLRRPNFEKA
jgi:hypothetical protein